MGRLVARIRHLYGASPLHLLTLLASFALVGYLVSVLGPGQLWNPNVWWQSILVWFAGAIVLHDLVLFPFYAVADRSLGHGWRALTGRRPRRQPAVPPVNYLRLPILGSGLLFLMFFPGIIRQGAATYVAATGQTQEPFLDRWLLITAAMFATSAVAYAVRSLTLTRRERRAGGASATERGRPVGPA